MVLFQLERSFFEYIRAGRGSLERSLFEYIVQGVVLLERSLFECIVQGVILSRTLPRRSLHLSLGYLPSLLSVMHERGRLRS